MRNAFQVNSQINHTASLFTDTKCHPYNSNKSAVFFLQLFWKHHWEVHRDLISKGRINHTDLWKLYAQDSMAQWTHCFTWFTVINDSFYLFFFLIFFHS